MKSLSTLLALLFFSSIIIAQDIVNNGVIKSTDDKPISGATIAYRDSLMEVSNLNGEFKFSSNRIDSKDSVRLIIRHISYRTIDTTVLLGKKLLTIEMRPNTYLQESVEISATSFNIFKQTKGRLIDFAIFDNGFAALYTTKGKKKLGTFDSYGFLIDDQRISEPFRSIDISCTGTILLIGRSEVAEYRVIDEELFIISYHDKDEYDQSIKPCIAKINDQFLLKVYSNYFKKINYFITISDDKYHELLSIHDSIQTELLNDLYNEILIQYTNVVRQNYSELRKNHYDYISGDNMAAVHLINDGLWNGNMLRLMVDERTTDLVQTFHRSSNKELFSDEFVLGDSLYILNYLDKRVINFNLKTNILTSHSVDEFDWNIEAKVKVDNVTGYAYKIVKRGFKNILIYKITRSKEKIINIKKLLAIALNPGGRILIHNNHLYYTSHNNQFPMRVVELPPIIHEKGNPSH